MGLTIIFSGLLAFGAIGLLGWHFKRRRDAHGLHASRMDQLEKAFRVHRAQLLFRERALLNYNFLKYNLSAALLEQPEIQV